MHKDRVTQETTMPWNVVERKIGRAGGVKQRTARQREWDQKYGDGNWAVGYVVDGAFVLQEVPWSRFTTGATRSILPLTRKT